MTFLAGVLLLLILGVSSSCSIPVDKEKKDRVSGNENTETVRAADFAKFPSVSFRVGGMMKTKSGAT